MTTSQAKFLVVASIGITFYQALVIRRLYKSLVFGKRQFNKLHEATDYLLEIIQENDIELTEFDIIALTTISEGK